MTQQFMIIDPEPLLVELRQAFDAPVAETLVRVLDHFAVQAHLTDIVTRQDFARLRASVLRLTDIVETLADAQQRTAEQVRALAAAQRLADERMDRVEAAVERLAEAQRRTEERVGRLEAAVERLAEAQRRTEERVGRLEAVVERLAEAQRRTEERVEKLAAAQQATDNSVRELTRAVDQLRRQVGGLSDAVGGDIEDIAYIVLHDVLQREFGWQVGLLERTWQTWDGQPEEVNIFGPATDPARPERPLWIVGEAKHNLTLRQVDRFARQLERARRHLEGEIFPVCFCYRAHPEVRDRLHELDIHLVFSYGRML